MGQAAPPPGDYIPPGNDCLSCYDPGKTPRWVTMVFSGMEKCDIWFCDPLSEPANGSFRGNQHATSSCHFTNYPSNILARYWATQPIGKSMVGLAKIDPEEDYFYGLVDGNCGKSFENLNTCSGQMYDCYNKGACAVVGSVVGLVGWLQYTANFEPSEEALNDTFEVEGSSDEVVRIVDQKTPTNIKIRYSYP